MVLSKKRRSKLPEPKEIVMLAHAELVRHLIDLDSFVTLCYARLDVSRCSAGSGRLRPHRGSFICTARPGPVRSLHGDNLPLGVREGEIYDQVSVPFEPGDLLLFYSDGITEARNPAGELFGPMRLEECVVSNGNLEPEPLVEGIRQAVAAFTGSERLTDDLTSVAIRVEERQAPDRTTGAGHSAAISNSSVRRAEFVRAFCQSACSTRTASERSNWRSMRRSSNIIKHAYSGRADQRIHMEAEAFADRVSVRLHHLGDPFDPSAAPPPALDGSRESGFGAYIISKSVDQVRYYRDERGRNCVALTKIRKC